MKYIKKFESTKGEYYSYEEIKDFFQEFIDDNNFNSIKYHKPSNQLESISGVYDIEFAKIFDISIPGYCLEENCVGFEKPSVILLIFLCLQIMQASQLEYFVWGVTKIILD